MAGIPESHGPWSHANTQTAKKANLAYGEAVNSSGQYRDAPGLLVGHQGARKLKPGA